MQHFMDIIQGILGLMFVALFFLFLIAMSMPEGLPAWWKNMSLKSSHAGPSAWSHLGVVWGAIWRVAFSLFMLWVFVQLLLMMI